MSSAGQARHQHAAPHCDCILACQSLPAYETRTCFRTSGPHSVRAAQIASSADQSLLRIWAPGELDDFVKRKRYDHPGRT